MGGGGGRESEPTSDDGRGTEKERARNGSEDPACPFMYLLLL